MTNKSTKSSVPVILITFLVVVLQGCAQTPRKQSLADQPAVKEDKVGAMAELITKLAEKEQLPQGATHSIWLAVIAPTGTDTMWQVGHPIENRNVRLSFEVLYSKETIDRARIAVLIRPVREAGQHNQGIGNALRDADALSRAVVAGAGPRLAGPATCGALPVKSAWISPPLTVSFSRSNSGSADSPLLSKGGA